MKIVDKLCLIDGPNVLKKLEKTGAVSLMLIKSGETKWE